ncbi:hypothetical protein [Rhizobium sp. NPDC090279]|uniref:hypothetical protein n=1 Tax=Rhizobium sp. NPDC090279 TaxID=3364499 RepID=UPI00383B43AA
MTLDERLSLALANQGKVHGFVKKMRIAGIDRVGDDVFVIERAGWYLLQDEKLSYRADVSNDDCRRSARFNAVVEFRDGSAKRETLNNTSSCNRFDNIRTGFEEVGHSALKPTPD